ncbi:MAG: DUF1572 family protein [Bacteroidota bacterium]|nr:DUF1572 family protein [Bacteroidota bacterium]
MLTDQLANLFERDIAKLKTEITAYREESNLWVTDADIANSGGNLCLHLMGNLQHYIGHILGGSGYERNRPEEFSRKNIPVATICTELDHIRQLIPATIRSVSTDQLNAQYPEKVFPESMTTEFFLLHLYAHLNYHLGQINYHRRLLDTKK